MWRSSIAGWLALSACGDNTAPPIGPPLAHADALFLVAHPDDEMIFMQPELLRALGAGSVTTVYATTAGPDGVDRHLFEATLVAYGGAAAWDCGALDLGAGVVDHCRLRDRPVSLVNFDLSDGGIPGDRLDSLLHLVDGTIAAIPIDGPSLAPIAMDGVVELFAATIAASTPAQIHTLDLAGTHGRDHSSHLFVASFALWAGARLGFAGPVTWHRGYSVEPEAPDLVGDDFAAAESMLGVYEACADRRGTCGAPSTQVLPEHAIWLARQYSSTRVVERTGRLALGDACLGANLAFGDCGSATAVQLAATGALQIGVGCVASTPTGALALEACAAGPAQYWVLDSEGFLWNGRPPAIGGDMALDHVRCLGDGGAATCGSHLQPRWNFLAN